ncbi:MAG: NfeD family protein, partial [Cyanobacteria bacterium K_DeepCast_35m_m2_023]|nr:NfeD family protein [Cyanobacteria bacterium K_DeepCast_35m_m2_023]
MVIPATVFWLLLGLAALGLLALGVDLDGLMAVAIAALLLSLLMAWLTWPATMQALLFVGTTLAVLAGLQRLSQRRRSRAISAAESANEA